MIKQLFQRKAEHQKNETEQYWDLLYASTEQPLTDKQQDNLLDLIERLGVSEERMTKDVQFLEKLKEHAERSKSYAAKRERHTAAVKAKAEAEAAFQVAKVALEKATAEWADARHYLGGVEADRQQISGDDYPTLLVRGKMGL